MIKHTQHTNSNGCAFQIVIVYFGVCFIFSAWSAWYPAALNNATGFYTIIICSIINTLSFKERINRIFWKYARIVHDDLLLFFSLSFLVFHRCIEILYVYCSMWFQQALIVSDNEWMHSIWILLLTCCFPMILLNYRIINSINSNHKWDKILEITSIIKKNIYKKKPVLFYLSHKNDNFFRYFRW